MKHANDNFTLEDEYFMQMMLDSLVFMACEELLFAEIVNGKR